MKLVRDIRRASRNRIRSFLGRGAGRKVSSEPRSSLAQKMRVASVMRSVVHGSRKLELVEVRDIGRRTDCSGPGYARMEVRVTVRGGRFGLRLKM
jgi:hypothetical protein